MTIEGYENYSISIHGVVTNIKRNRQLNPWLGKNGYLMVDLTNSIGIKKLLLHRIIATAYVVNDFNKPQVNHIDGVKTNNSISNLEWVTPKENIMHAHKTGLTVVKKGIYSPNFGKLNEGSSRAVIATSKNGEEFEFPSVSEAVRQGIGYSSTAVNNCLRGLAFSSGGYKWKYLILA